MDDWQAAVRVRIAELEKDRDEWLAGVREQLAAFSGGIGELKRLIGEPVEPPKAGGEGDKHANGPEGAAGPEGPEGPRAAG